MFAHFLCFIDRAAYLSLHTPFNKIEEGIPTEMANADDVDFISMIKHIDVGEISKVLKK